MSEKTSEEMIREAKEALLRPFASGAPPPKRRLPEAAPDRTRMSAPSRVSAAPPPPPHPYESSAPVSWRRRGLLVWRLVGVASFVWVAFVLLSAVPGALADPGVRLPLLLGGLILALPAFLVGLYAFRRSRRAGVRFATYQ